MSNSKISIITASYNYENYIKETLESVIAQTVQDWEMVIVDDGSTDNSINIIKEYCQKDSRIKLFTHCNHNNKGLIETLKLGISKAEGEWLIFLESDDTIESNYIEEKLKIINSYPQIKFIYNDINMFGDAEKIEEYNKYFNKLYKQLKKVKFPAKVTKLFKKRNIVPTFSCVMAKKELFLMLDWNCSVPKYIDYFLWSQIAYNNEFYFIKKKLTNWRMHKNSYVNDTNISSKIVKHFFKVVIPNKITNNKYNYWYQFLFNTYKIIHFKG